MNQDTLNDLEFVVLRCVRKLNGLDGEKLATGAEVSSSLNDDFEQERSVLKATFLGVFNTLDALKEKGLLRGVPLASGAMGYKLTDAGQSQFRANLGKSDQRSFLGVKYNI